MLRAVYGKGYAAYLRLISSHRGALSGSQSRTATPARSAKTACGSAFLMAKLSKVLLTKVTKPSQRNLLSCAVSGTRYGYERNAYIHDERGGF